MRQIRESRGLTRDELAAELTGCTASAVNKWERNLSPVPGWVEEKLFRTVKLELPLDELHALLDLAREEGKSFLGILGQAVHEYLAARATQPAAPPLAILASPGAYDSAAGLKVAEDPPAASQPGPAAKYAAIRTPRKSP